ncbi:MAG TPA: FAD-dependent oxidoreductase, partial [Bacteroidales bacterium]|nr:FAD-dependent oxidoreductase [Bacteroidales bacterium]
MRYTADFLIIGSGIAGLTYALKVAPYGKVIIVTKDNIAESNTRYAQGGIAAVMYNPDSFEKHIQDTITAGAGLCDEKIVRIAISESAERIKELIEWGTNFDKTTSGKYDLAKEGGHSEYRVLHHKDNTGKEIIRALTIQAQQHPNIEILENHFSIEIITQHHLGMIVTKKNSDITCYGSYVLNTKKNQIDTILSKFTLMATGGCG